ncbi:MAG: hypothetical protein DSZ28_09885 [Thiothrix sp.]|nr:MAG: hypothetical protein DSZ28_09885 [Thiothrix sp.]
MRWILLLVGLLSLLLHTAVAKEFIPRLGVSVEQNDNINKTRDNPEEGTVVTPYFGFVYEDQGPQLDASVDFEVRNERYTNSLLGNQNLFSIDSYIDWVFLPNRFIWAIEDVSNTQRITAFDTATPDNLQNFNVFTTGPDYIFSSATYEGLLKLRFGDVSYSDAGPDNQRIIASASAKRLVNEYSSLGLSSAISFVDYEEEFRSDDGYDIGFVGATYERELPYGTFEVNTGVNWVAYDNGVDESAPMGELVFEYDGGGGVLRLAASTKYSDPALDAYDPLYSRSYDVGVGDPVNANEISGDGAFDSERVEANYTRNGKRVRLNLLAYLNNRKSLLGGSDADVEEVGYSAGLSYQLRESVSLWARYNIIDNDFTTKGSYVEGSAASTGLDYILSRDFKLTVGASFGEEKSDDPKRDFSNDIVFLKFEYTGVPKEKE